MSYALICRVCIDDLYMYKEVNWVRIDNQNILSVTLIILMTTVPHRNQIQRIPYPENTSSLHNKFHWIRILIGFVKNKDLNQKSNWILNHSILWVDSNPEYHVFWSVGRKARGRDRPKREEYNIIALKVRGCQIEWLKQLCASSSLFWRQKKSVSMDIFWNSLTSTRKFCSIPFNNWVLYHSFHSLTFFPLSLSSLELRTLFTTFYSLSLCLSYTIHDKKRGRKTVAIPLFCEFL